SGCLGCVGGGLGGGSDGGVLALAHDAVDQAVGVLLLGWDVASLKARGNPVEALARELFSPVLELVDDRVHLVVLVCRAFGGGQRGRTSSGQRLVGSLGHIAVDYLL